MKTTIIVFVIIGGIIVLFYKYLFPIIINKLCSPSPKQIEINNLYHHFKENPSGATDSELKELNDYFSAQVLYVPILGTLHGRQKYSETLSSIYLKEIIAEMNKRKENQNV